MKLTSDQLTELESLASYFFTPDECAIVLSISTDELEMALEDDTDPGYKAYQRGKLKSKLELRKSILTLAKQGSSPAQTMALRLLDESESLD